MSKNGDIVFIGFNKYTKQPIKENTYKNWVMNGKNNENYKFIIDMYNGSTTNKAINNAYIDLAYGRGLAIHDDDENETKLKELLEYFPKKNHKPVLVDNQILGELAFQVHRQKGNKKALAKIEHIAKANVIPSIEDEDGNIRSYWYSADWDKQYQNKYKPREYPALGYAEDFDYERPEIYVGKPYVIGTEYFATPDYDACLQYCSIEQEISNFYDSHIKNGLSFGTIINVPNSAHWDDAQKDEYIKDVKGRYTGSSAAGRLAFNFKPHDGQDSTISNVENNTAHKQWDFLTKEASSKIISAHKCMSPMIVGLGSASGFSSKSDEMDMMEQQLMKRVIAPKQDFFLDCLKEVFETFNLEFDCYLRPLTEIEGEKEEEEKVDKKDVEQEVEMSKKKSELEIFIDKGEIEDLENYDIIDENEVDYNEEIQLVSTGTARPNSKSSQDTDDIVIRYRYVGNKNPERAFCKAMMSANKVYRKEDIEQLSNKTVNAGWGPNGVDQYSIWLYKGGGNCHHKWNRVIYLKKGKSVDVNSPLAKMISTSEARRRGYKVETNDSKVSIEPRNMKNKGFLKPR
jgi:hypothetical protein